LTARRALARLVLLFEAVWPALWPALGVAGLFIIAALLDLPAMLPGWAHFGLLAVTGLAVGGLAVRGLWRIGLPDRAAADRRLEQASGLQHRPLSMLGDRPSQPDPIGEAIWQAHLMRLTAQIDRLKVGAPHPGLPRRDRKALRAALVVGLVAALAIAGRDAPDRLLAATQPSIPDPIAPAVTTELRAWITPPAYTRSAPVFLNADGGAISVPAGSRLTVSLTGGTDAPSLTAGEHQEPFAKLDGSSFQAERGLTQAEQVIVSLAGQPLAAWEISVVADQAPVAGWTDKPGRAQSGLQVRLPWKAADDYGVASMRATLRLDPRPAAEPIEVPIPLPAGTPKTAQGVNQQDLTAHPWAGLPVTIQLTATDAIGQIGVSDSASIVLPERPFQNPIARMLIELRKGLSINPDDRTEALAALDQLLLKPDLFAHDPSAWINLSALYSLLARQRGPDAVPAAQERMWLLALHLEEGQADQTARALEQTRRAVREAMERAERQPTEEHRRDLEQRLRELQEAIDRHMQAMMEQARRDGSLMDFDPEAHRMTNHDLDRLAERAREAAREGRMDEARRRVEELEQLLEQLKNSRVARGRDGEQQQGSQQRQQRGRQQMGAVQDMIGRQGGLLDQAEGRNDPVNRPRGAPPPPASADSQAQREADRRVQNALRRSLGELMQQFGDLTGEIPPALTEADQAMRESSSQLGQGQDRAAGAAQQRAIEALQKGAQQMGQAMARQFGPSQGGEDGEQGPGQGGEPQMGMMPSEERGEGRSGGPIPGDPSRADPRGRDPLGRYNQGTSSDSADVTVPEERERQRTQAIQEELRRRGAERERPAPELDYIDRLLRQF
jgi:uncharacterized protein (TIGR02302 family)